MSAVTQRPWTPGAEARLLIWSIADKPLADYARATGRTYASVRTKLSRLRKDAALRPPEFSTPRDAAAPRVSMTRGSSDTPDGK